MAHSSALRNKGIATIFYDIGLIEQWGSGIDKMRKACINAGVPEPQLEEYQGFRVTFRKDIYTEEYLRKLGLNERQIKAVGYVKGKGKITNKEYCEMLGITVRTARTDLNDLWSRDIFEKIEKMGKKTEYFLILQNLGKAGNDPGKINMNIDFLLTIICKCGK
jgi:ATP-dependent DNA helicase RecG